MTDTQQQLLEKISRALADLGATRFTYEVTYMWCDVSHSIEVAGRYIDHEYDLLSAHSSEDLKALEAAGLIWKIKEFSSEELNDPDILYRVTYGLIGEPPPLHRLNLS